MHDKDWPKLQNFKNKRIIVATVNFKHECLNISIGM